MLSPRSSLAGILTGLSAALTRLASAVTRKTPAPKTPEEIFQDTIEALLHQFGALFAAWQTGTLKQDPEDFPEPATPTRLRAPKAAMRPPSNHKTTAHTPAPQSAQPLPTPEPLSAQSAFSSRRQPPGVTQHPIASIWRPRDQNRSPPPILSSA